MIVDLLALEAKILKEHEGQTASDLCTEPFSISFQGPEEILFFICVCGTQKCGPGPRELNQLIPTMKKFPGFHFLLFGFLKASET